jgi:hypothetical protein
MRVFSRRNFGNAGERSRCRLRYVVVLAFLLLLLLAMLLVQAALLFRLEHAPPFANGTTSPHQHWAYVFFLGACDPTHPSYRGGLYNILVATYVLKHRENSPADVLVLVQMAHNTTVPTLPQQDISMLETLGVKIRYIPKPTRRHSSFYELVIEKMRVFTLVEYTRVLFLDTDVLPLCNLDYLFMLSEKGILQENVLHAMYDDPVNAGLFVITPNLEHYQQIQQVIRRVSPDHIIPPPNFDPVLGWGGQQEQVDYELWNGETGQGWSFYCADADQGLLLYWTKYLRQSVSIIIGNHIEHTTASGGTHTVANALDEYSCLSSSSSTLQGTFASNANAKAASLPFYRDFHHAVGYSKFWEQSPQSPAPSIPALLFPKTIDKVHSSTMYWYFLLQSLMVDDKFQTTTTTTTTLSSSSSVNKVHKPLDSIPIGHLRDSIGPPAHRGDLFVVVENPT